MSRELIAFFGMMLCGTACGMLYDIFRSIHSELKNHDIIVMITDIMYWSAVTGAIMWSLWYFNTGELRTYEIVGLILGAVLYFLTLGRLIYKFFLIIVGKFARFMRFICKMLLTLWGFLYKILMMAIRAILRKLRIDKRKSRRVK